MPLRFLVLAVFCSRFICGCVFYLRSLSPASASWLVDAHMPGTPHPYSFHSTPNGESDHDDLVFICCVVGLVIVDQVACACILYLAACSRLGWWMSVMLGVLPCIRRLLCAATNLPREADPHKRSTTEPNMRRAAASRRECPSQSLLQVQQAGLCGVPPLISGGSSEALLCVSVRLLAGSIPKRHACLRLVAATWPSENGRLKSVLTWCGDDTLMSAPRV